MNLKRYLLLRMALVAMLCWLVVSLYLVAISGQQMTATMERDADQMRELLEAALQRQHTNPEPGPRTPQLWQVAGRFTEPFCLRYQALNGSQTEDGCGGAQPAPTMPRWLANLLTWQIVPPSAVQRDIHLWGLAVGTLTIEPDQSRLLARHWHTLRDLLWLATATVLALGTLIFLVIDRALRPAGQLVAALDHLAAGEDRPELWTEPALPQFEPREFGQIAAGINRLSARLTQLSATRAELMGRLINIQEKERRELAHELHDEFGQCIAALSANSAMLRGAAAQGETISDSDFDTQEQIIERMLTGLRSLLLRMSPPLLESRSLRSALNDLMTGWQAGLFSTVHVTMQIAPDADTRLPEESALCIYRVMQECLNNIARHARHSAAVEIDISPAGEMLLIRVTNQLPKPLENSPPTREGSGIGLRLLAERLRTQGGQLVVEAHAGKFTVTASLPLDRRKK